MTHLKRFIKLLTGLMVLVAFLGLTACGEQQQAPKAEVKKEEKKKIGWFPPSRNWSRPLKPPKRTLPSGRNMKISCTPITEDG